MARLTQRRHMAISLALATAGPPGVHTCQARKASAKDGALALQVLAPASLAADTVQLSLKPMQGATLVASVGLTASKGLDGVASPRLKRGSLLVRAPTGRYALQVHALDSSGAPLPDCSVALPGPSRWLETNKDRVRPSTLVIECKGSQSPLRLLNRSPQNFRITMPRHSDEQQGSFASSGEASFCLSAWDADHSGLRFEAKEDGKSGCLIQASPQADRKTQATPLTQQRCYTVKCRPNFHGRVKLRARVFDQVWRGGSKVDIQGCAGHGAQENCQGASYQALDFSLKFVRELSQVRQGA